MKKHYFRYPKTFDWKAFMKFDIDKQEILCNRYDIILTGHMTREEKIKGILSKFTIKNVNQGVTKFNKGMDQFTKMMGSSESQKAGKPRQRTQRRSTYREPKLNFKVYDTRSLWGSDNDRNKAIKDLLG